MSEIVSAALTSDAFKELVPADVASKMLLEAPEHDSEGYRRLALPKIGRPVADALRRLATSDSRSDQAVIAEHLAERIEERVRRSR